MTTHIESPFSGDSIYIRKDDPKFFPDEFTWVSLNHVVESLKQDGWTESYIKMSVDESPESDLVAILFRKSTEQIHHEWK